MPPGEGIVLDCGAERKLPREQSLYCFGTAEHIDYVAGITLRVLIAGRYDAACIVSVQVERDHGTFTNRVAVLLRHEHRELALFPALDTDCLKIVRADDLTMIARSLDGHEITVERIENHLKNEIGKGHWIFSRRGGVLLWRRSVAAMD